MCAIFQPRRQLLTEIQVGISWGCIKEPIGLANALLKLGAQRGSKVAFMEKTATSFLNLVFGCAKIGVVALL